MTMPTTGFKSRRDFELDWFAVMVAAGVDVFFAAAIARAAAERQVTD